MTSSQQRSLHHLARLYNVQKDYIDVFGQWRQSPPEALIQVLQTLGAPIERMEDLGNALRERRQFLWRRFVDPVLVAWDGEVKNLRLRLPSSLAEEPIRYQIERENGECSDGACLLGVGNEARAEEIEGVRYVALRLTLPERLPHGYHRIRFHAGERTFESLMISAPLRAYSPPRGKFPSLGIFAPLYALHSQKSWGAGDFSDLERLLGWFKGLGGKVVGTLPLLGTFLEEPFDPSPYSPVSRLFWNEFYLDVTRIPEFRECPAAQDLIGSSSFQGELERLRASDLVDYRRQMALKRSVLELLAQWLFSKRAKRYASFERFVKSYPQAEDYARFRAVTERQRRPWMHWPEANRDGVLQPGDYDNEVKRYHLYAQWVAQEQIQTLAKKSKRGGPALYLDFPLGVHSIGYDTWRERDSFAMEMSSGAPPDSFFTQGQNWGFPPFHPEQIRTHGYRYYIASLHHHLKHCSLLRIDHVMGLNRLFWIPQGMAARDGVYVRYHAEEFYSILSLESHRHQTLIVGENLGTVPSYVNTAMARHGIYGMYVGQFDVRPDPNGALGATPASTVASLNTHDTPTFAAFWHGHDIDDRLELGLLNQEEGQRERQTRQAQREALISFLKSLGYLKEESQDAEAVLVGWLKHLSREPAGLVLVNLEDLWLETQPQNVPGTHEQRPNWRRRTRYSFEEFSKMARVLDTLRELSHLRKRVHPPNRKKKGKPA